MAVRFDASTDELVRTTNLPPIAGFTMMGWFKISVDRNDFTALFTLGTIAATAYQLVTAADGLTLELYDGSTTVAGSALTVGTWTHLAITVSGTGAGQFLGYVNGVLNITHSGNAGLSSEQMRVGNNTSSEFLNGCAAAVKIYGAALVAADIAQEMRQILPVRTANLNTFSPLFSTADDEVDFSGNGFNWTVNGTLATEDGPPVPWKMGRHRRLAVAAAAGTTISPGVGSVPLTGRVPTLSIDMANDARIVIRKA